ncbi:MAG: ABC transporter ATP-binding protein [Candidatus Aenigmarchaeota archaeon]|nr:ABC transporter ATP-binding protein [Candidatus Aenigmarchaeota archaeon]
MSEYMIETQGLTKKFGDLVAVNGISIKVKQGTIHGFIGPNGAGKTTTMKMLIGALRPSAGGGAIKGSNIGSLTARKVFGFSPEHPRFYENMNARDYLVYMGKVSGLSGSRAGERAVEMLRWLELDEFAGKKVGGFSAGMRQKLSLAQAMIHEPELLILDEPTANLDPAGRLGIIKKLRELAKEKKITVFISSHILSELEKMVDEVTIISHGKIVTESGVKDLEARVAGNEYLLKTSDSAKMLKSLQKRSFVHKAWIDESGAIRVVAAGDETVFRKDIAKAIASNDVALEAFGIATGDLEQVFMKLVGESDQKMERVKRRFSFRLPFLSRKRSEKK